MSGYKGSFGVLQASAEKTVAKLTPLPEGLSDGVYLGSLEKSTLLDLQTSP